MARLTGNLAFFLDFMYSLVAVTLFSEQAYRLASAHQICIFNFGIYY